jgi:MerR family transcriptional regulator, thiopeptide resistance regulator
MAYTVKQLAKLAGVSARTLHYYDEIGLLKPDSHGDNGYRYYGEEAAPRLQQILFFKELGLSLQDIQGIIDCPEFDVLHALQEHKLALQERAGRLERLIHTVDKTINHLKGTRAMKQKELFEGFSEEKQKEYQEEIIRRYGDKLVRESDQHWGSYSVEKKAAIIAEQQQVHRDLAAQMGKGAESREVQQIIGRWYQNLRNFYEPTVEVLSGLGRLYIEDPQFTATFNKIHPDLAEFFNRAIQVYCKNLEDRG